MRVRLSGTARHFGPVRALDPVDLDIPEGAFVAIVGPSGCGTSTLLRLVAGLLPASDGIVEVGGRSHRGPVPSLGFVFQQPTLLEWRRVLGNVLFQVEMRGQPARDYRDRALALLDQMGLREFADSHPHQLSGGMKQRVAIARALVHDPGLLLMDEPFGALDALTREQMRIDLEALWLRRRMTTLFVTHSVDEAVLLADRVVVMSPRPGRVEVMIEVDIPRPRGLTARRHPEFLRIEQEITEIFLARGVLQRHAA
ncbi:MAG TPA: ABC transporter ATP-binding protein [Acetobacteraceae bacterium]|jgi:NitT/TauT family transport system ATP-binding protein|nr:ABC transporter ATP-binding protein [Acetobacteraceae bacterium]